MPSPALTLGRDTFDAESLRAEDPDVLVRIIECLQAQAALNKARGWDSAATTEADTTYKAVYTRQDAGDDKLYGGEPNDPLNPTLLNVGGGGSSVTAGLYIDITTGVIDVDLTEVSGYNGAAVQYLRNNAGTIEWVTVAAC